MFSPSSSFFVGDCLLRHSKLDLDEINLLQVDTLRTKNGFYGLNIRLGLIASDIVCIRVTVHATCTVVHSEPVEQFHRRFDKC